MSPASSQSAPSPSPEQRERCHVVSCVRTRLSNCIHHTKAHKSHGRPLGLGTLLAPSLIRFVIKNRPPFQDHFWRAACSLCKFLMISYLFSCTSATSTCWPGQGSIIHVTDVALSSKYNSGKKNCSLESKCARIQTFALTTLQLPFFFSPIARKILEWAFLCCAEGNLTAAKLSGWICIGPVQINLYLTWNLKHCCTSSRI